MVNNQIPGPVDMGIANSYIALTDRPALVAIGLIDESSGG
jgi:hypothetical protein